MSASTSTPLQYPVPPVQAVTPPRNKTTVPVASRIVLGKHLPRGKHWSKDLHLLQPWVAFITTRTRNRMLRYWKSIHLMALTMRPRQSQISTVVSNPCTWNLNFKLRVPISRRFFGLGRVAFVSIADTVFFFIRTANPFPTPTFFFFLSSVLCFVVCTCIIRNDIIIIICIGVGRREVRFCRHFCFDRIEING